MSLLHKHLLSSWISNPWKEEVIFSLWKHASNRVLGFAVQLSQADTSKSRHRASIQTCLDPSTLKMHVFSWGEGGNYINGGAVVVNVVTL